MITMKQFKNLFFYLAVGLFALTVPVFTACQCDQSGGAVSSPGRLQSDQPNNQLIFSNVYVNEPKKRTIKIFNAGTDDVTVTSLKIVHDTYKVFSIIKAPKVPFVLKSKKAGGDDASIVIQFLTKKTGNFQGELEIASPDADNVDNNGNFYIKLRHQVLVPDIVFECEGLLDFKAVEKGNSKTLSCKVRNRGNAELKITGANYVLDKGSKGDFKWTAPKFPVTIPADDSTTVEIKITYTPSDYPPKVDEGNFYLDTNIKVDNEEDKPKLHVIGSTKVPLIELLPVYKECKVDSDCKKIDRNLSCVTDPFNKQKKICRQSSNTTPVLKFPLTSKKKTTKRIFLIRSTGDLPLSVDQIELDSSSSLDFHVVQPAKFPIVLAPRQEKEITVEYTPTDDKEDSGSITVTSNAGNLPKARIKLEAASHGCNLEVKPRKLNFPAPRAFQVDIINVGDEVCIVNKVFMKSGKNDPFFISPVPKPNQSIARNGRLSFFVKFKPKDKKEYTDAVVIQSTDPDEPVIEVETKGKMRDVGECELTTRANILNFQLVPVGRSKKLSLELKNEGWGTCVLSSISIIGINPSGNTAFSLASQVNLPLRIKTGGKTALRISYTPQQNLSGYEGSLEIKSNDQKQPTFKVKLIGSSGNLCLEVVPQTLDFGSTKFGCATPKRTIEIFNLGAAGCSKAISISKIELSKSGTFNHTEFRFNRKPMLPATLSTGQSIKVEMSYKAKDLGEDHGSLEIHNSVPGQSPMTIPLFGEGVKTNDQQDVFKQLSRPLTDIMFVIDDSCSMSDDQNNLAINFKSFINWALRLNVDYHIGATTTDVTGRKNPAGCLRGTSTKFITPQTPNAQNVFAAIVKAGTNGSATEKGLEAAYRALIPPVASDPKCNRGFYRKPASLSMIFVSDEPDQSPQTVGFYISFFKNIKGFRNVDLIRASAIGPYEPNSPQCTSGGCRYYEVTKQLHGIYEHITNANWGTTLSNLGSITFGYRTQFFLSRQADPKTITVKVNATPIKQSAQDGWTYDPSTNAIVFSKNAIPPPSSTISVQYKAICLP